MAVVVTSALSSEQRESLFADWLKQRPLLQQLLDNSGQLSLVEYVANYYRSGLQQPEPKRQQEFLTTFTRYAQQYFDPSVVAAATAQLQKYYSVSTADHQAPLFPSLAFQANTLTAAAYAAVGDSALQTIIVLGCSSVSLNHRDSPRGLQYHVVRADTLEYDRLNIFPSRGQMWPVYATPAYTQQQLKATVQQVQEKMQSVTLPVAVGERLQQLLAEHYANEAVLSAPHYSAQLSRLNYRLWPVLQPKYSSTQLLYLDEEGFVAQLLLDHHIAQDTAMHQLIFTNELRSQLLPKLEAAMGTHLSQQGVGTDLFWAVSPHNHHRVALRLVDNVLVSSVPGESIRLELTPDGIAQALAEKRIFPNLLLCYAVLSLYYQLNCTGGFNQMHYITAMQAAYQASGCDTEFKPSTTLALHYGLYSAFIQYREQAMPLDGMDLWLYGTTAFQADWQRALSSVIIAQALPWLAPNFWRYLPPAVQTSYEKTTLTKFRVTDSIERSLGEPALLTLNK